MRKYILGLIVILSVISNDSFAFSDSQGCCSYHGGISNMCSLEGQLICQDGFVSSCGCIVGDYNSCIANPQIALQKANISRNLPNATKFIDMIYNGWNELSLVSSRIRSYSADASEELIQARIERGTRAIKGEICSAMQTLNFTSQYVEDRYEEDNNYGTRVNVEDQQDREEIERFLARAKDDMENKRYESAIYFYEETLKLLDYRNKPLIDDIDHKIRIARRNIQAQEREEQAKQEQEKEEREKQEALEREQKNRQDPEVEKAKNRLGNSTKIIEDFALKVKARDYEAQQRIKKVLEQFKKSKEDRMRYFGIYLDYLLKR